MIVSWKKFEWTTYFTKVSVGGSSACSACSATWILPAAPCEARPRYPSRSAALGRVMAPLSARNNATPFRLQTPGGERWYIEKSDLYVDTGNTKVFEHIKNPGKWRVSSGAGTLPLSASHAPT